ncbi:MULTISPECIES: response regulator transcription factor [unclassified Neptuniibacter]|jgi:DNA-binding NarL/FixJ family response regulator|uniref:response regulator n=1 Tax=unclassified Neptuniibacter TaxID=2630693 RepID=UPI0026E418E8|nr:MULTISPECIES: response regulator transcription factor [unclassified Neptuniibacter]MDO6514440.1 response regulator transcription factor [Neptuniibacter sp. 2_MG-2023]MDO6594462.1 response regulator transcription factor [Neptuniibacter sp. 1_MG-2023]
MKIIIADDHAVVRQGYSSLLSTMLAPCDVLEASNGDQAFNLCQTDKPDIVIMDVNMQGISGVEATRRILQRDSNINILFFSMYDESPVVAQAMEAGAKGYITKSCTPEILIDAVKKVAAGQLYVEHELAMRLAVTRPEQKDQRLKDMTQREFEIFVMLAQGCSVHQISEQLFISNKTVSNYTSILKSKLQISSTAELVHLAIETGVVKVGVEVS